MKTLQLPLKVKIIHSLGDSRFVVLTDANGEILPGQKATILECSVDDLPALTVQFTLDGENIILGD